MSIELEQKLYDKQQLVNSLSFDNKMLRRVNKELQEMIKKGSARIEGLQQKLDILERGI